MLPMVLAMLISMPVVQTYLVGKLTDAISSKIKAKVSIGSVSYSFFNRLSLGQVYVEDQAGDTLMYVDKLSASLSYISFSNRTIQLGTLELDRGEFNLRTMDGETNIKQILDELKKEPKDTLKQSSPFSYALKASELELDSFKFTMKKEPAEKNDDPNKIDFNDLQVDSIYLRVKNIRFEADSLHFAITSLQCQEKSGFKLQTLSGDGYVCGKQAMLRNVHIKDPYTDVRLGHFSLNYVDHTEDLSNFIEKVRMDGDFLGGYVSFKTVGFFAPVLSHITTPLVVKGFVSGTVANLKADSLYISTVDTKASVLLSARMYGLPDINQTSIYVDIKSLYGTSHAATALLSDIAGGKVKGVYPYLNKLKIINFKGKFTGLYNDFVASGKISTGLGSLDLNALFTSKPNGTSFSGRFGGVYFDVGQLLSTSILGSTTFDLSLQGRISTKGKLATSAKGKISLLEFNDYNYEHILLSGDFENKNFNGKVSIDDPNLIFDFNGKLYLATQEEEAIPEANFTLQVDKANLFPLHFNKRDSLASFRGFLSANFKGEGWQNWLGNISIPSAHYTDKDGDIDLGSFTLMAEQGENKYSVAFNSEYLDASFLGVASPGKFAEELEQILDMYVPALTPAALLTSIGNVGGEYKLAVNIKKPAILSRIFFPNIYLSNNSYLTASIANHKLSLDVAASKLLFNDIRVDSLRLATPAPDSTLYVNLNVRQLAVGSSLYFKKLNVAIAAAHDVVTTTIRYDNSTTPENSAKLVVKTAFTEQDGASAVAFSLVPSKVVVNGIPWELSCRSFVADSSKIQVDKFSLSYNEHRLAVDGVYSSNVDDTMSLSVSKFRMNHLNYFLENIGYDVDGLMSGQAKLFKQHDRPLFFASIAIADVVANNHKLGDILFRSSWSDVDEGLRVSTKIVKDKVEHLNVTGSFIPDSRYLNFDIKTVDLEVAVVQPFLTGVLSNLQGTFTGKYVFQGSPGSFKLIGEGDLKDASAKVDFLNTTYSLSGKVVSKQNRISMEGSTVLDEQGNKGLLNVAFPHEYFKRFQLDLKVQLDNMLGLNTTVKENDMFYGKAYASGTASISGLFSALTIEVNAETKKNTKLFIMLPTAMAAKDGGGLLTFYVPPPPALPEDEDFLQNRAQKKKNEMRNDMLVKLNVRATNDAEVNIIIDARNDDVLTGAGSGDIKMEVQPSKDIFKMYGEYVVDRGNYTLVIPNFTLLKRDFLIDKGGVVKFNGDINQTNLNVKATYSKLLRVSLEPLLADGSEQSKSRYQVQCKLGVTGNMLQPVIKPIIQVSNIDSDTEARVQNALNTEEKAFKQFLSLLAFGVFTAETTNSDSGLGADAGLVNLSDILSSQLISLLSEFNLPLDFEVRYSSGTNGKDPELDVDFSRRISDKMIVSGSINTSRDPTAGNTTSFAGDFDLEYMLTPSIRLKGFSHSTDPYSDLQEGSRFGGAISYQKRFSTFKGLWHSIIKKKPKKEEVKPEVPVVDSLTSKEQL